MTSRGWLKVFVASPKAFERCHIPALPKNTIPQYSLATSARFGSGETLVFWRPIMTTVKYTDGWIISEVAFDVDNNRKFEGLFTIGSGYLHMRGSLEEHIQGAPQNSTYMRMPGNTTSEKFPEFKARWGTYVPGVYGKHPVLNNELINLPYFAGLAPIVAGERLDLTTSRVTNCVRSLNMKEARIERSLDWSVAGAEVRVTFDIFIDSTRPGLCAQRLTLTTSRDMEVSVDASIDSDVRTNGYDHFTSIDSTEGPGAQIGLCCVTDRGEHVRILSEVVGGREHSFKKSQRAISSLIRASAKAHVPVVFEKYTVVGTSQDAHFRVLENELQEALSIGYDGLLRDHIQDWERLWRQSDVIVEGDSNSQLAIRASLYHLLRSHPRDERVAIDAKGYAGEAYFGRFFWDTEMYLVPFFLYTDPERAKQLMRFRALTLDAAKSNAKEYGYCGARYAWESDKSGIESCASWQYRDHEIHVTADIAYAFAHIAAATTGNDYFTDDIAKVIVEGARFWCSRIDHIPARDKPALLGVMGPDEYSPISNNNAYTNKMVKFNLELAATVGARVGASKDEIAEFRRLAADLPILRRQDGLVLQNEAFETLAEPAFEQWRDRSKTFAAQVSQERLYRSKNLKQADVLMMMFLFGSEYSDHDISQAWDYYVPVTTHDSSLSAAIHSILACRLGKQHAAWDFWLKSCMIDVDFSHGGPAEGIHIAACAGNWMNIVYGFAGIKSAIESPILSINPALPKALTKISFPLIWNGSRVSIQLDHTGVTLTHLGEGAALEFLFRGKKHALPVGQSIAFM